MKRKAEKADIVKRKVFHEHIILLTEGRFLMLAVLAVMVWLPYLFVRDRMAGIMSEWLPEPYERVFAAASDGYEARRRKKERKRIEKKMKMIK